jgi:hypothetical protein
VIVRAGAVMVAAIAALATGEVRAAPDAADAALPADGGAAF